MKLHHRRRNGNSSLGSIFFEAMRALQTPRLMQENLLDLPEENR